MHLTMAVSYFECKYSSQSFQETAVLTLPWLIRNRWGSLPGDAVGLSVSSIRSFDIWDLAGQFGRAGNISAEDEGADELESY